MSMKTLTRMAAISFFVGLYVGCSPVKFSLDDSKCKDSGCVVENGKYAFNYSQTAGRGKVDILIVNDNSASMSFEQARLAPRFQNFIADLDNQKIDYRIAMTTTDVARSDAGSLVSFGGNPYITPSHSNRMSLFNSTIQRPETLACEKFIANWIRNNGGNLASIESSAYSQAYAQNCPSGDERGVYAANLVVKNNPSSFIRSDAHLAVIFLADEDERSGLYGNGGYVLDQMDQPNYLINNVKSSLGADKFNSLSVHAIVVKDNNCLAQQNSQTLDNYSPTNGLVTGSIGNVYLSFTNNGWGMAADICSNDYTSQLGQIRSKITDRIKDIMLNCSNPQDLIVTVSGSPVGYNLVGKTLKFNQYLSPGTSVSLSYKCESLD
ncbi:conserved hypothetical protein [Bdellovibrio bacteriovorus HD100]|uniref:VWFA domain-containing protein n=2 Tax=Bdellovibrio bacteriovorus TaxID=959 RepID=Q6MPH9_BDEBA|nr:conserved hypothetical protein [Bdellovibrio bacteriovorus HD100]